MIARAISFVLLTAAPATLSFGFELPGPTPPGTVRGSYDPATGEIVVTVNSVLSWFVESRSGSLTGPPRIVLATSIGGVLITDNDYRIGHSSFASKLTYQDHSLGFVAARNLPLSDLYMASTADFGSPEYRFEFVPEPGSATLALAAALALASGLRRRGCSP